MDLDDPVPSLELPLERPLFSPPHKPHIDAGALIEGISDVPPDALFNQVHVDRDALRAHIRRSLQVRASVSLADLIEERPLALGLAELCVYLTLAADDRGAIIDDSRSQTVGWDDGNGTHRQATLPLILFTRPGAPREVA